MNTSTNSSPVLDPAEGVYGSRRASSHSERPGFLEASRAIAISLCLLSALYFGLQLIRGWVS